MKHDINKIEVFYTGGGIWQCAMYVNENEYFSIDTECGDEYIALFDHRYEDNDIDYPTQYMVWEKHVNELNDYEKSIHENMLKALKDEAERWG